MSITVIEKATVFAKPTTRIVNLPACVADLIHDDDGKMVSVNGSWVLRKNWHRPLADNCIVKIQTVPREPISGAFAAFATFVTFLKVAGTIAVAAGLSYIAYRAYKIWSNFPTNSANTASKRAEPSPTYGANPGNYARIGSAIPVIYGNMKTFPDLAQLPYRSFTDNEEFLHLLLLVGQGQYDVENVWIGDTQIADFGSDVEYATLQANGINTANFTQFDLRTVSALEVHSIPLDGEPAADPSVANQIGDSHDNWIGPYVINNSGTQITTALLDFVAPNGINWNDGGHLRRLDIPILAEFIEVDNSGNEIGNWQLVAPNGITAAQRSDANAFDGNSSGFRRVGPFPAGGFIMTADDYTSNYTITQQVARTYEYTLPRAGRWKCRVRAARILDDNVNKPNWFALKGELNQRPQLPGDALYIAAKLKATEQLSVDIRNKINIQVERKLPNWQHGVNGWSRVPESDSAALRATRVIEMAIMDMLTNTTYGIGMPDSRIDVQGIFALRNTWYSRGDRFDAVFDRQVSAWEALTHICQAGRATPVIDGGELTVVRDQQQNTAVAQFDSNNIVRDSLRIDYLLPSDTQHDGIEAVFFNRANWREDTYSYKFGGGVPSNPERIELFGITDREHAKREVEYRVRAGKYRRRIVSFDTEMDGLLPGFGSLVRVQTDIMNWGFSSFVESVEDDNNVVNVELANVIPYEFWRQSEQVTAMIRTDDGTPFSSTVRIYRKPFAEQLDPRNAIRFEVASAVVDNDAGSAVVTLRNNQRITLHFGGKKQPTAIAIGVPGNDLLDCIVSSIKPSGTDRVAINAINEDARVHIEP